MVAVLGRHAGLLTTGLIGAVVIAPLAAFTPLWGALALGAGAAVAAGLVQARATSLRARCDKLSAEVDLLSRRLVQIEAAPRPDAGVGALRSEVDEATVEIGLLSGIVRDLTAVVGSQDGEIARLKAALDAATEALHRSARGAAEPASALPPAPRPQAPSSAYGTAAAGGHGEAARRGAEAMVRTEPAARQESVPRQAAAWPSPPAEADVPRRGPAADRPDPTSHRPTPPRPVASQPVASQSVAARPQPGPGDGAVVAAFEADGLEIHLQPVVTLPQRKVVSYEALARLRVAGQLAEPALFLPALERHGHTTELDRRMLARAATIARHLARRGSEAAVTYGLSSLSLFEPGFLRELARMTADEAALIGLTVALPQAGWRRLDTRQRALLGPLRGRIGFCLDRPDDLRFDAADLAAHGVGQVRVPAGMLLRPGPMRASLSDIAVEDTVPALARAGIRLVATDVAAEADVPDLIDLDVPFAQGTAFAEPRPVRSEVLSAPADDPAPPPPERRPFRSVLRRAV